MRTRAPRRLLALVLASFCAVTAAQEDGREVLAACLEKFADDRHSPAPRFEEISERCPDLKSSLEHSTPAGWLPEYWWGPNLSTSGLADLRDQIVWEASERARLALDTKGVAAALASIEEEQQATPQSWLDRVLEWLRERMQPQSGEEAGWTYNLWEKLVENETAVRITAYALLALIVLIAVLIVVNEMREAGVFSRRARSASAHRWEEGGSARGPDIADLDRAALIEQPAVLLELLVAAFDRSRIASERVGVAATHRELAARVALGSPDQRTAFGTLVRCAERVRYAAAMPEREDLERAVAAGRRLLEALAGGGAARA